jgi:glycine cleavage system aminomethyltransferase T
MRLGGARAYHSSAYEAGWIPQGVPAIFGPKMQAYRQWLPGYCAEANTPLMGSFASTQVQDYYFTPWCFNYGKMIKFDHDFIGANALKEMAKQPQRRKVWLRWDQMETMRLMQQSLFGGAQRTKSIDLPNANAVAIMYDQVLVGDRPVGFSTVAGYTVNIGALVSLGVVGPEVKQGDEVTIVWGDLEPGQSRPLMESHIKSTVKATVHDSTLVG